VQFMAFIEVSVPRRRPTSGAVPGEITTQASDVVFAERNPQPS
jgi:hypothetical protein